MIIRPLARFALALLALPVLLAATAPGTFSYSLDQSASTVEAKVAFLGISSETATFRNMSGRIVLSPQKMERINLDVTLDATTLEAGSDEIAANLRGKDFFDTANHPTVRFVGTTLAMTGKLSANVDGQITARGVTKPARLAVTFAADPAQATGRDPISLTGTTTIDRTKFGMKAYKFFVGKKVKITIKATMVPG
jgi:polyisoprenoid-binding protein YceI